MSQILVRQATLEDVAGIVGVFRSNVGAWVNRNGQPADYAALSLYERWRHSTLAADISPHHSATPAGAWFSAETCAVWLAHLLQGQEGIPLVADRAGEVVGVAEAYLWQEAEPYHQHIHIATLSAHADHPASGVEQALIEYTYQMAGVTQTPALTLNPLLPPDFLAELGFEAFTQRHSLSIPAEEGRVFYKAKPLESDDPAQVREWYMPLGRFENGRADWELMSWHIWRGIPALVEAEWHRLTIEITGQPGILHLHQHTEDASAATARLWTKRPITTHMLSAVLDRAARLGYTRITTLAEASTLAMLPAAVENAPPMPLYRRGLK